jgi:hypothetical protein
MVKVERDFGWGSQMNNTRLIWPDLLKAIALIWIFLNHVTEQLFGYPYIANPMLNWPLTFCAIWAGAVTRGSSSF